MADFVRNVFGGQKPVPSPAPVVADSGTIKDLVKIFYCTSTITNTVISDFADFAGAPEPSPVSILSTAVSETIASAASPTSSVLADTAALYPRPYTKWYRVWERVYIHDFYSEMFIVPFLILLVLAHLWGSRKNRSKAKAWLTAHGPVLQQEFACVGFSGRKTNVDATVLSGDGIPKEVLKQRTATEFITYATGRQNVAFVDVKLTLHKRFNPMGRLAEEGLGLFFESMPAPKERMEATSYVFDGREADLVLSDSAEQKREKFNSTYDGFVWAVVHKDVMNFWRQGRYDLSLTTTRDHPKLPSWAVVMTESAEITDLLLKPELIKAIEDAGDNLEALIISDQPIDKPLKYAHFASVRRIKLTTFTDLTKLCRKSASA